MRPRIVYSKHIPAKGYIAILILLWMVVREEYRNRLPWFAEIHEGIHLKQLIETFFIGIGLMMLMIKNGFGWWSILPLFLFYILYVAEFFAKLMLTFSWKKAYMSISFEQEAYSYQYDKTYLENRRHYAWLKYVFKLKPKK